jgi:predicted ester cyclase
MFEAFPDGHMTLDELTCVDDLCWMRATYKGTHTGEFMGMAPTNKSFEVTSMDCVRFEDGMMVEHWGVMDALGMMQQLGMVPEGVPMSTEGG